MSAISQGIRTQPITRKKKVKVKKVRKKKFVLKFDLEK